MLKLKEAIGKFFNVDLPISGGNGQSIDDPIIINAGESPVTIEYQVIGFIQQLGNKKWDMEKQETVKKDDKYIDKVSIVLEDDPDNYRNYYFDITQLKSILFLTR